MWLHEWEMYLLKEDLKNCLGGVGKWEDGHSGKANWLRDREGKAKAHIMLELPVSLFFIRYREKIREHFC